MKKKNFSGQAIFLVLVILGAVMGIGLIFSLINISRLHMAKKIEYSVPAYYAAESGAECQLYKDIVDPSFDCDSSLHMKNGTSYTVSKSVSGSSTIIDSFGRLKEVYRAVEIVY